MQEPIEEVFDQNTSLAKKVDDMHLKLEALTEQNYKLLELLQSNNATGEIELEQLLRRPSSTDQQRPVMRSVSHSASPPTVI